MREIKFRLRFENKIVGYEKWYECQWWYSTDQLHWVPGKFDLAVGEKDQFTGLKDKHGKEIYDGDVGVDGENDALYEVRFDEGAFVSIYDTNVIEYLSEVANQIEVIGNIYENPELLNVEQK